MAARPAASASSPLTPAALDAVRRRLKQHEQEKAAAAAAAAAEEEEKEEKGKAGGATPPVLPKEQFDELRKGVRWPRHSLYFCNVLRHSLYFCNILRMFVSACNKPTETEPTVIELLRCLRC